MRTAWNRVKRFLVSESGPTAVQYAMLLLLAVLACLTIITAIGQRTAVNEFAPQAGIERPAIGN
jgi:pilus assembly protein Flp/PilA